MTFPTSNGGFNVDKYQRTTSAGVKISEGKIIWTAQSVDDFKGKVEISGDKIKIRNAVVKGTGIMLTPAEGKTYALELADDVAQLSGDKTAVTADAQIKDGNYIGTSELRRLLYVKRQHCQTLQFFGRRDDYNLAASRHNRRHDYGRNR